ncbi:MAG: hypothetical protein AB1578_16660 [Thermodesulfobacteriota bacterium]
MAQGLRIERFSGRGVVPWIPEVARLCIAVFREYPYLCDGTLAYEQEYLKDLAGSASGVVVTAFDGDEAVGASTGMPLEDLDEEAESPKPLVFWVKPLTAPLTGVPV